VHGSQSSQIPEQLLNNPEQLRMGVQTGGAVVGGGVVTIGTHSPRTTLWHKSHGNVSLQISREIAHMPISKQGILFAHWLFSGLQTLPLGAPPH